MSANPILQQKYNAVKGDKGTTALVKAIRQNETDFDNAKQNPYKMSHDNGTGFGAYGYQKSSWKQWAKDYSGDENLIPTPENQDIIAYLRVHDLKNQYGKAADVLSVWNSGKPAAQASAGYNAKLGLNYDTPAYIQKGLNNFKNYYDQNITADVSNNPKDGTILDQIGESPYPKSPFVNKKDEQVFGQKQKQYEANTQFNQNPAVAFGIRQPGEELTGYDKFMSKADQVLGGGANKVSELGTGLRRLGAKVTNQIGLESNLDPNSPTYNPLLDKNSATSQLAREKGFKGQTPLEKVGGTTFDIASIAAPGLAAESLATKAPLASKGLGLLAGDTQTGKGIASKLIGRNISDIPGVGGYLADKAVGLGTNIIGGLAQTALKEGGISGKDAGEIAGGTLISSALFSGFPALASGIRSFTKPEKAAKEFVESNPNKAEQLFESAKNFIRDSLSKSKLKSTFGLSKYGKEAEDDALNVAVGYLPHLIKEEKGVNAADMYQAVQDDTSELVKKSADYLRNFKGDVYNPESMLAQAKQRLISEKGGGHVGFIDEAYNKVLKILKQAGPKKQNISAEELHNLVHDLSTYEFAGKRPNVSMNQTEAAAEGVFKDLARSFRNNARETIANDISSVSPEFGNKYKLLNSEINSKLNAADIIEAISKDPTANKQFTDHMIGLIGGFATGNPAAYVAGRMLSKLGGKYTSQFRFDKTVNEPVLQEVTRLRNQLLQDMSEGKVKVPKGKLKLSDIINQKK